jgi:hypothetical protein
MFRLVVIHRFTVVDATGDGVRIGIRRRTTLAAPLLYTSSSLGDAIVEAPRRQLFRRMVLERRGGWLRGQARFHRHQWPARREISVRMERADALTVSRTVVDVTRVARSLSYEALGGSRSAREVRVCCSVP